MSPPSPVDNSDTAGIKLSTVKAEEVWMGKTDFHFLDNSSELSHYMSPIMVKKKS